MYNINTFSFLENKNDNIFGAAIESLNGVLNAICNNTN